MALGLSLGLLLLHPFFFCILRKPGILVQNSQFLDVESQSPLVIGFFGGPFDPLLLLFGFGGFLGRARQTGFQLHEQMGLGSLEYLVGLALD